MTKCRRDFRTVLAYLLQLAPLEVRQEQLGKRKLQNIPPADLGYQNSLPGLLNSLVDTIRAQPDERSFTEFLEAAEDFRHYYRDLSKVEFGNTLALKWLVDSIVAVLKVHISLLMNPEGVDINLESS